MKSQFLFATLCASASLLLGCAASTPPTELTSARHSYQRAKSGQAARLVATELRVARMALATAENAFEEDPLSSQTRALAVIADQSARSADSSATDAVRRSLEARESRDRTANQIQMAKETRENLAASPGNGVPRINAERTAKLASDDRAALAKTNLATIAVVNEDQRGLVITLPGNDLFASYRAALLPAAQKRLDQVANALLATKGRKLTIEGHMDSRGAPSFNQDLSQQRAEAVRSYIVSKGYPGDLILAQGIGKERPIADNASAEGRANNQRVEIIVDHEHK